MYCTIIAAVSEDGFIAGPNGDMTWVSSEDASFLNQTIGQHDVLIMGRGTFMAHKNSFAKNSTKKRIVITRYPKNYSTYAHLATFTSEPLKNILESYSNDDSKILILGGCHLYTQCQKANLADTLYITVEPTALHSGTQLLSNDLTVAHLTNHFELIHSKQLNTSGTVLHTYKKLTAS